MRTRLAHPIEDYEVESIRGVKEEAGKIFYLVNWTPTWLREDQLIGCEMLIEIFMTQ